MNAHVFVNRTLNLKRIKFLGLDMDHTLIRYKTEEFERLSHTIMKDKLIKRGYPEAVRQLPFVYNLTIRGLVIDKKQGNILKLNRHSAIRASFHGLKPIDFKTQQKMYKSTYIDLSDQSYLAVDTAFSLSLCTLFAQIVEMKNSPGGENLPDYERIADDVLYALDEAHRDGSLKDTVQADLDRFIIKDPETVEGLEKFKLHGKKIFIVTNSDFHYTKLLLDYAINPFLKNHKSWLDLFEIVVTFAQKPRYFYDNLKYLKIKPDDGSMVNHNDRLSAGVYQGGSAQVFTADFDLQGDEILYIGDHIYGDILRLKKDAGWRTAMVIDELDHELSANAAASPINAEIESLMHTKEPMEDELTQLMTLKAGSKVKPDEAITDALQDKIAEIDSQISSLIRQQQALFNSHWGPLMRSGNEESYFAYQVDRYACVYMPKLSDLLALSPRTYFRAPRRPLAHEI
jgi:HAD superfamily 5'-nucleotidase-like hydrolase